jgi:transposase-like protein
LRRDQHKAAARWYVDETYLKLGGEWVYLYRAIDRDGNLIDAMLSEHRAMTAPKDFFRSAKATMGFLPDRVTTDGHGSPIQERSTWFWGGRCCIAPALIGIIVLSRTIAASRAGSDG